MPELPEVETVRLTLLPHLQGRTVTGVSVLSPKLIRGAQPARFAERLIGRRILNLERRGKYLLLRLDGRTLIVHLMMAGRLLWTPGPGEDPPHTHVVLMLDDGSLLRYADLRRFGSLQLVDDGERLPPGLAELGPEPLGDDFTPGYLMRALASGAQVKGLLLNQRVVAGLGNIYADEVLFAAGVHPKRRGRDLTTAEVERIHAAIREILPQAIAARGTTFATYVDGEGRAGGFAGRLRVYRRQGLPCPRCGTRLEKIRVAGRGTHLCPRCQTEEGGTHADRDHGVR